ncbi:MAG: hypothetical protein AAB152_12450 [Candidatus Coatesbacteria bacterium]
MTAAFGSTGGFFAKDLVLDSQGQLIVAGTGSGGGSGGAVVAKLSPTDGSVIWKYTAGPLGSTANAVAVDASDNVYVAGTVGGSEGYIAKINSSGTPLWTFTTGGGIVGPAGAGFNAIAVDSTGVVAGGAHGGATPCFFVVKIPVAGAWWDSSDPILGIGAGTLGIIWTRTWSGVTAVPFDTNQVKRIALDSSSNVYVASTDISGPPGYSNRMSKYSSTNVVAWSLTSWGYNVCGGVGDASMSGGMGRLRVAPDGTLWGVAMNNLHQFDPATGLVTKSGMFVSSVAGSGPTGLVDFAWWTGGVAVFASSTVVAGRTTWSSCATGGYSFSSADGWEVSDFSSVQSSNLKAAFVPAAVALGANGDVFVAGSSNGAPGGLIVVALRDVLAQNPVKAGTLEIRNNIINLGDNQTDGQQYAHTAYIFVRAGTGATDKNVKVSVFGPSGRFMGQLTGITIGADGTGSVAFDGVVEGKRLSTGMYYIVVSGAGVKDRKPIMILGKKDL